MKWKKFNTFVDDKNILTIVLMKGDVLEMNFFCEQILSVYILQV